MMGRYRLATSQLEVGKHRDDKCHGAKAEITIKTGRERHRYQHDDHRGKGDVTSPKPLRLGHAENPMAQRA